MSIKQDIIKAFNTPSHNSENLEDCILYNEDHIMARDFRAFLDGGSMEGFNRNLEFIYGCLFKGGDKKMWSWVIQQHTSFIAKAFNCSYGHAQKCVVAAFNTPIDEADADSHWFRNRLGNYTMRLRRWAWEWFHSNESGMTDEMRRRAWEASQ